MADQWEDPVFVMVQSFALAGFLHWAIGEDDVWAAFTAETGLAMPAAPKSQIDQMIDDATGVTDKVMRQFVAWIIPAMWGPLEDVPPAMRGLCEARL